MYKFYEMQQIQSSISIALRKKSGAVTAANVRDNSFVDSLVQHDDGFHILKGLRSAPAHWEAEKKVIARIRQFGLPTFFITLFYWIAETLLRKRQQLFLAPKKLD